MILHPGISAESIACIHFKINNVAIKMFAVLAKVGRLGVAVPFNARAPGVDELGIKPFHDDFFVIRWIGSVTGSVRRLASSERQRRRADEQYTGEKRKRFHALIFDRLNLLVQRNESQGMRGCS